MTSKKLDRTPLHRGEVLFWDLADALLQLPTITRSTMMGYPCLRQSGAFFACIERATGYLIVKLPEDRVQEMVGSGRAIPFAPNGRIFREWAAFPRLNRELWTTMLDEALEFAIT
jgi:hypothetical protein